MESHATDFASPMEVESKTADGPDAADHDTVTGKDDDVDKTVVVAADRDEPASAPSPADPLVEPVRVQDDPHAPEWVMSCEACGIVKPIAGYFNNPTSAKCAVCERKQRTTYQDHGLLPL